MHGDAQKLEEDAVTHLFDLYVQISSQAEEESELEQDFRDTFKKLSQ